MREYLGRAKDLPFGKEINLYDIFANAYWHIAVGLVIILGGDPDATYISPNHPNIFVGCTNIDMAKLRSHNILVEIANHFSHAFNASSHLYSNTKTILPVNRCDLIQIIAEIDPMLPNLIIYYHEGMRLENDFTDIERKIIRDAYIMVRMAIGNLNELIVKINDGETTVAFSQPDSGQSIPLLFELPALEGLVDITELDNFEPLEP
jgi:hypothetical protein